MYHMFVVLNIINDAKHFVVLNIKQIDLQKIHQHVKLTANSIDNNSVFPKMIQSG